MEARRRLKKIGGSVALFIPSLSPMGKEKAGAHVPAFVLTV